MTHIIDGKEVTGLTNLNIEDSLFINGNDTTQMIVHPIVQTRTQAVIVAPASGDGVEIAPLTPAVFTPTKAGNIIICDWHIVCEIFTDSVFLASLNGTLLPDATDGSNNIWAGITPPNFDNDDLSTPATVNVRIVDRSSSKDPSTYRVLIRGSQFSQTLFLNRPGSSTGAPGMETGMSTCIITELIT